MPGASITIGVLLILVGLIGYIYGMSADRASVTALIPAAFGVVLAVLGVAARASEGMRKHLMHAAVVVALLGFIATAGRLLSKLSELSMSAAVLSQVVTAALCLIFMIMAIRSFAAARRGNP
ncbi:MAG: hypothetical protein IPM25_00420 [Chloracidobacterium sp.]|nr:hypothetical protein [Chloracidobacterium sp.]